MVVGRVEAWVQRRTVLWKDLREPERSFNKASGSFLDFTVIALMLFVVLLLLLLLGLAGTGDTVPRDFLSIFQRNTGGEY